MFKHLLAAAVLSAATMLPAMASPAAGTASDTLHLNASVVNACSVTVGTINMTAYDVFGGDSTGSTTASVTCTKGASPNIAFASSVGLSNGTDTLNVGLTQDGALGVSTSMSAPQSVTINADAASGQDVSAGDYSGSTTVTISF